MNAAARLLRIFALLAGPALVLITVTWLTQPHSKRAPASRPALPTSAVPASNAAFGPTVPATSAPAARHPAAPLRSASSPIGPHEAGMIVGIDPETGEIGPPTPEQRAELEQLAASRSAQLSRSSVGLVEERRPDGTVHLDLQGRFQEYSTVRIGPDGRKAFGCVDDTSGFTEHPTARPTDTRPSAGVTAPPSVAMPAAEER